MSKNHRAIKASLILGLFVLSMVLVSVPSSSAQSRLFNLKSVLEVRPESEDLKEVVAPFGIQTSIDVELDYSISGLGANLAVQRFSTFKAAIRLSIKDTPDWISAQVSPNVVQPQFTTEGDSEKATVYVTVTDKAPALAQVNIVLVAEVEEQVTPVLFKVEGLVEEIAIPVTPGYLPTIGIEPDDTFKTINSGETATFNIAIDNLANGKTEVKFLLADVPDGWTANIPTKIIVGSNVYEDESRVVVPLTVQPPYSFGYHHERENVRVAITPKYFASTDDNENYSYVGQTYYQEFTIESRGFSTPGFEVISLFAVISIMSIAIILKKKKYKN